MAVKNWDYWKTDYQDRWNRRTESIEKHAANWTPIEKIAFLFLDELQQHFGYNNLDVFPQANIGPYRVDFLLRYTPLDQPSICTQIVVECDGHDWHEKTKEQAAHDKERDRYMVKLGYTVFRYTGSEIVNNPEKIYGDIEEMLLPDHAKESFGYKKQST